MTRGEAKKLTIKVWQYLADHPEIEFKEELPLRFWDQIKDMSNNCPLCKYFHGECIECPLGTDGNLDCYNSRSDFGVWLSSKSEEIRKAGAQGIVKIVKNWYIGGPRPKGKEKEKV